MVFEKLLSRLTVPTFVAVFGLTVWFAGAAPSVCAQSGEKVVSLAYAIKPQLKFVDLKDGQRALEFGEGFEAGADWLENLSFKLENASGKTIVYLQLNLNFPETRATGNLMSYGISFGLRPDSRLKVSKPNEPLLLKSGESLEISFAPQKDRIYNFVGQRQPFALIQKAELEIGFVIFDDKTAWTAGAFLRRDAENPDRYVPVREGSPD